MGNQVSELSYGTNDQPLNFMVQQDHIQKTDVIGTKRSISASQNERKRQVLVLSRQGLEKFPSQVEDASFLSWLDISRNVITSIPDDIARFPKLKRLACGTNRIQSVSPNIGQLKDLNWLDLTHNELNDLPESLGNLSKLNGLGLSDCRFQTFPIAITNLRHLQKLGMFGNSLINLPKEIGNLRHLTKLDLSNNRLQEIPDTIGLLTHMKWLNLSNNQLTSLPHELNNLINLEELGLGNNMIKKVPKLDKLCRLKILPLFGNELREIGTWIGELKALEKLDLSSNQLHEFPSNVFDQLPVLAYLNLRRNQIVKIQIPEDWNYLSKTDSPSRSPLTYLNLADNKIENVPYGLYRHLRLQEFLIRNNPLTFFKWTKESVKTLKEIAANNLFNHASDFDPELLPIELGEFVKSNVKKCHGCKRIYFQRSFASTLMVKETNAFHRIPLTIITCSSACAFAFK